jgi:hypothetical protein
MKKEIIGLIGIIIAVILIIIAACSNNVKGTATPSEGSPAPSSVQPSPSPSVTYTVKTDYSQLTPYEPMEEIYTRLSDDYMPELVPSDDYGMLVPYVGEVLYVYYVSEDYDIESYAAGYCEGLVTTDGMIVTDAVFVSINRPSYYDASTDSYIDSSLYILEKPVELETAGEIYAEKSCAVCALDGSWITPFDYIKIIRCDQVMLLFTDYETKNFDVMDYSGKILYNSKELDCFAQLQGYPFYYPGGGDPSPKDSGGGYIALWDSNASMCAFMNEMSRELTITEFSYAQGFSEGLAAVEKDGLWGYIDTGFSQVIAPAYKEADSFSNGTAVVLLPSGENAVIDTWGNILLSTQKDINRNFGYFTVGNYGTNHYAIYDSSLRALFGSDEVDTWNDFYGGYSYVKDKRTTILYDNNVITLPGESDFHWVKDNYILYGDQAGSKFSLMTLQGVPVAQFSKDYSNWSIHSIGDGYDNFVFYISNEASYSINDKNGENIASGNGHVYMAEDTALLKIYGDDYFAYMDTSGKYIFRISLLDCIPD